MAADQTPRSDRPLSRRHLLLGGAAAGIGAASAIAIDIASGTSGPSVSAGDGDGQAVLGGETVPFYGRHQAGIETTPQSNLTFVALDLRDSTDAAALRRMMRILTDDAARLTLGVAALADSEPELAAVPARLTITFGFGPGLVARAAAAGQQPQWLRPLPRLAVDRLEDRWSGGDLLLQIAADDALTVAHASRMLLKDTRTFASVRWVQNGFRRNRVSEKPGTTMRNLFGQVDGTVNPVPGTADFDELVWAADRAPAWLVGGTSLVVRRIAMDLDKWDKLDRSGRESTVGRNLATGAPLSGRHERDEPDFEARSGSGFPVIPEFSHLRRARSDDRSQRIYRRGYNYDDRPTGDSVSDSGLLFASFQADVDHQFVPLQRRLDELDLLNQWTTPVGSAVFAIPPGCSPGGYIGEALL